MATYATGIGPWKMDVLPDPANEISSSIVIEMAHKHGLAVHPYTFRSDMLKLPDCYMGNATEEYARFFKLGVDGVFSDWSSHARHARHIMMERGARGSACPPDPHAGDRFRFTAFDYLDEIHPQLLHAARVGAQCQQQR